MATAATEMDTYPALRTPDWYWTATRWTQLTFTDDDPVTFDVEYWIDVMRRTRSNALCLSAGGYMAFYPTQIPFHHKSQYLGNNDPFGDLVEGARSLGMHVMARVDPHAIHQDAAEAHPEWLARDEYGHALEHESMKGLWWTDPFSSYHREFTTEVALEITREYDIDAIFANRWEGPKRCMSYGTAARRDFLADTGMELPSESDPSDPAWAVYRKWHSQKLSELVVLWDDAVREVKPHVRFIPNRGANLTRDLVRDLVDDRYPMFFVDKQGRSGTEAAWEPGRIAKRAMGLYPERPVALITSVGPESHDVRWKDSVADPQETVSLIVDGFAHGARPWFTKFKAEMFDSRWIAPMEEAFGLHAQFEPVVGHLTRTAEVALLDSRRQADGSEFGSYAAGGPAHEDGVYQALLEARIPFNYIADEALSAERLRGVRVLVLPACPALSAENLRIIEDFVANGGSVVAMFDSSLSGSAPDRRLDLGELFGVRLLGEVSGLIKNKYMSIEGSHPVSAGYDGAQRIVAGSYLLPVELTAGAQEVFRFVPDYPDLPMEEVYPRPGVSSPAVVTREHTSGGRTVYFAFNLGEIYWQFLQSDHGRLLANAVRWALGEGGPHVEVSGRGLVDVAVQEGPGELAVTLVNLTNPMAMRGQSHELIPLEDQLIRVRMPQSASGVCARLLYSGEQLDLVVREGMVEIPVKTIDRLEIAHVTWVE